MEKHPKPQIPLGKKRQRKTSLGNASEPKNIKMSTPDSPTKLKVPKLTKTKIPQPTMIVETIDSPETPTKHLDVAEDKFLNGNGPKNKRSGQVINAVATKKHKPSKPTTNSEDLKPSEVTSLEVPKKEKKKKFKVTISEPISTKTEVLDTSEIVKKDKGALEKVNEKSEKAAKRKVLEALTFEENVDKYPVLKDKGLIERFMKVPLTNNQKGRIRLVIKSSLQGTSNTMFPEIINGKIQAILKGSQELTDTELRRIRILYNMLKTALEDPAQLEPVEKTEKKKKKKDGKGKKDENQEDGDKKEKPVQKVKGPKRYVVFIGNLPLDINKEQIISHFQEVNEQIKDIRIPKVADGKKSAIAFVELANEPSYELALSKHHSMLANTRIRVLYSTQQNSKISKSEAKSKSAKLIAMQKAGKLVGSTPQGKKRSHRRNIMKKAQAKEAAETA